MDGPAPDLEVTLNDFDRHLLRVVTEFNGEFAQHFAEPVEYVMSLFDLSSLDGEARIGFRAKLLEGATLALEQALLVMLESGKLDIPEPPVEPGFSGGEEHSS